MSETSSDSSVRDADLFTSMWETIRKEREAPQEREVEGDSDRRYSRRFPFDSFQLAALCDGGAVPSIDRFKSIHCHDLSQGGFSYFSDIRPLSDEFVLLLQRGERKYCLKGRVVHSRPVDQDGRTRFLVGCKFTGRIRM